ncbi:MAG: PQQ-binding-like beta-propeller repeat protein [Planctomycetes bacterium]|nr:PQQ-binding-like beta-propeller repeat protein [Planctomycetota bacterium]MBL7040223.1 PQQ-binding-like beta-propeller repeat protein [Pirellulaceae bacterium]
MIKRRTTRLVSFSLNVALALSFSLCAGEVEDQANQILEDTGIKGGLIVHVGCGDGKLTAALRAGDQYLVHGLDCDEANVRAAREHIRSLGLYGKVSVEQFDGTHLPHTDNLANLVVFDDLGDVSMDEVVRVLAPGGVALSLNRQSEIENRKSIKPRPTEIDEWTHYLYDASNNAVSKDTISGPPHHVQWIGGPKWARGHEQLASVSSVVSSGGRVFYIVDEASPASVTLPSNWTLMARDAFNGVLLWKRSLGDWEYRLRPFRSGPPQLSRRLVSIEDRVYVTLGYGAPLTALDAATGEVAKEYEGTEGTEEIVYHDGTLYLVVGDVAEQRALDEAVRRGQPLPPVARRITAINADTGQSLWTKTDVDAAEVFALSLVISQGRAFFQTKGEVICLNTDSGQEIWRSARPASLKRPGWSVPTLVVYGDVLISADRKVPEEPEEGPRPRKVQWDYSFGGGNAPPGDMIAFSTETGERLWSVPCREGYNAPVDVLVADGLLWSGNLVGARDPGITVARDPATGEVKRERPDDHEFFTPGMSHHRCYRNKATERFIMLGRSGVEFVDVQTGKACANHWIRGTCQYGVMPANGLLYVPQHTCACYIKTKLNSFNALAPERESKGQSVEESKGDRLQRGPAFTDIQQLGSSTPDPDAWPTYRHDIARSGATASEISADLENVWQTKVGGRLSSVVSADGKVFVADIDDHSVHAFSLQDGQSIWSYTTGGRVDSPPTVYQGLVLFGSADGWVYCLRASDGAMAWRFRAAPEERRAVIYDGLESAWPVSGSVLVQEGVAYFAAGRSSFLDGGIYLYGVDATTGEQQYEFCVSGRDPETGEQPKSAVKGFDMPGGLPDVLSGDGTFLYMRDLKFDRQCVQQADGGLHLFSPTGYLDDSWWHRSYWIYGSRFVAGWGGWWQVGNQVPAGRLLAFDDSTIYGFGRSFYPGGNAGQWNKGEYYHVFATSKDQATVQRPAPKKKRGRPPGDRTLVEFLWSKRADVKARALVLAGKTLFMAGPLGETHHSTDAFEGREGIRLQATSTEDGSKLAECELDSLPVFDGMAAADGRLLLVTKDGKVRCFGGK